jgi:putative endonuclease
MNQSWVPALRDAFGFAWLEWRIEGETAKTPSFQTGVERSGTTDLEPSFVPEKWCAKAGFQLCTMPLASLGWNDGCWGLLVALELCKVHGMRDDIQPAVYIMANRYRGTIYIGVTSALWNRVSEHKEETFKGFTSKYGCKLLVWYEHHSDMASAIERETQMKAWKRNWKIELIEKFNPDWLDLHDHIELFPFTDLNWPPSNA